MMCFQGKAVKSADEICDTCILNYCVVMQAVEALGTDIKVVACNEHCEVLP